MGAITQETTITGKTLNKAFSRLKESDREEHGTDPYNGSWYNAPGVKEVSMDEFRRVEKNNGPEKHAPAVAVCIKKPILNTMKTKTSVTSYPSKGTRKWETRYEVEDVYGRIIVSELKQADAISKARQLVEKDNEIRLTVNIAKVLKSSPIVAEISYKRSSTERDGTWDIIGTMAY